MEKKHSLYQNIKHDKEREKPAIICFNQKISYSNLDEMIKKTAGFLINSNIKEGDTVSICLPNIPSVAAVFYAADLIGAKINMMHPLLPKVEIKKAMEKTGSRILFILDTQIKNVPIIDDLIVVTASAADSLSPPLAALINLKNREAIKLNQGGHRFKDLMKKCAPISANEVKGTPAIYLHSGGTLGDPKTITLSAAAFNALALRSPHMVCRDEEGFGQMNVLMSLPAFHGFGLCICMHNSLIFGATVVMMPRFEPKAALKTIEKRKINLLVGVPKMFEKMMSANTTADLSSVTNIFGGGDIISREFEQRFNEFLSKNGCKTVLMEGFGQTECVTVCAVNTLKSHKSGTCGKALPNIQLMILGEDNNVVELGKEGELCVAADTLMDGYLGDEDSTNRVFFVDGEGTKWLKTGDLATMDSEGFITFKQRINRIYKVSGFKVFPSEVEQAIMAQEGVLACAVTMNDGVLTAHIVFLNEPPQSFEGLKAALGELLPYWSVPKRYNALPSLPQTLVAKVDYRKLERM